MNSGAEEKPVLAVRNAGVHYVQRRVKLSRKKFWAIKDVSLDLFHGETLGVIGRNGAGKSTLIKLLAGIISPDKGYVYNPGVRVLRLALEVGFIPHLSGRDNAVLSGMLMGLTHKQIVSRLDAVIEFSELEQFIDQPVRSYSSGMRARLGFSVALQSDPDVLLIDEMLGVGDATFRKKSADALHKLIRSDKTVVLVSHNLSTLRDLCDRMLWLEDRVSRQEGSVEEVLGAYSNYLETLSS